MVPGFYRDIKSFICSHKHVWHEKTNKSIWRNEWKWKRERKETMSKYGQSTQNTHMPTTKYNKYITIKIYNGLPLLCTSSAETRQYQYQNQNNTHDPGLPGHLWGMPCHLPTLGMQRFKLEEEILSGVVLQLWQEPVTEFKLGLNFPNFSS